MKSMKKIGIIGMGYVGLPLWINFSKNGFQAVGFDAKKDIVASINKGQSYIGHIPSAGIKKARKAGSYGTSDMSEIQGVDAIIICVPTPISKNREPDLQYVKSVMSQIAPFLRKGQLISLESTTYPGTTEELIIPVIEEQNFTIGKDFYVVYSPERENPGGDIRQENITKILGGATKVCSKKGHAIYSKVFKKVEIVSSIKIAELTKLLENIHRAVNLGMINEFKMICDKMGVDTMEVVDAAATKPFGFVPYYPGPGWGGHCIPVDPFYFSWKAKEFGMNARFIELAGEMNLNVQDWLQEKILHVLNLDGIALSASKILLLGLSYKENVDDARESPSLRLYDWISVNGGHVKYSDPHFPKFPSSSKYTFKDSSVKLTSASLKKFDLVVLLTKHKGFDYPLIQKYSKRIIDTRGVFAPDQKLIFRG